MPPDFWEKRHADEALEAQALASKPWLRQGDIPFLGGRPDRETVISTDDILNLQIALNTAQDLEKFCALT